MSAKERSDSLRLWHLLAILGVFSFLGLLVGFMAFRSHTIEQFESALAAQDDNTIFYDIDGQPFHVIQGEQDRKYVPLSKMSRNLQMAVVAIEDARFFQHFGFDPIRILGAIVYNIKNFRAPHGASTISQQLIKLTLLSPEQTLSRKLKELFISIAIETKYSKAEILEFYLNRVYLGHRNYGVENAALNYFHKNSKDLSLAEGAFIAGLIKKPEGYSPFVNLKGARTRQILVLMRMRALDWISKEEYQQALNEHILIRQRRKSDLNLAPFFTNQVLSELKQRYTVEQIYGGGLRIYTTLNRRYQETLEAAIHERLSRARSFEEIGAVSIDPATGFVEALVGGADFNQSEFNRVTQARRQPGSAFKAILYSAALSRGLKPNDVFLDEPVQYANSNDENSTDFYAPENYSGEYSGEITLAQALKVSNNVVSVQILKKIGIQSLVEVAERFGLEIPRDRGLCLALGCAEVSLLELTNAYSVFTNSGMKSEPVFILKVTDSFGNLLQEYKPKPEKQVLSSGVAFQMNRMLQAVVTSGTGRASKIEETSGGKTGTTDGFRDAWFIGYTAGLVTGIWIGNDNNEPMDGEVGGRTPARLWKAYMKELPATGYERTFPINDEFEDFRLCDSSGLKATEYCPKVSWYPLRRDTAPLRDCDIHGPHTLFEEPSMTFETDAEHQLDPATDVPMVTFPEFYPASP
ncbi:MAG: PBP1A family penicillin-binding protein [bacterium]|nr:PBP1A family penicillin-binding protein [bacterium]